MSLYCSSHSAKWNAWLQSSVKVSVEEMNIFMNYFGNRSGPNSHKHHLIFCICDMCTDIMQLTHLSFCYRFVLINKRLQYYNLLNTCCFIQGFYGRSVLILCIFLHVGPFCCWYACIWSNLLYWSHYTVFWRSVMNVVNNSFVVAQHFHT